MGSPSSQRQETVRDASPGGSAGWAQLGDDSQKTNQLSEAFDQFDPNRVAKYDKRKVKSLLSDAGIIRNELKIRSAIQNAEAVLAVQHKHGSFDSYVWRFVGNRPRINRWKHLNEIPAMKEESTEMSKNLLRHGFRFVGPKICYAYMQAVGMVNDHVFDCFRYPELGGKNPR